METKNEIVEKEKNYPLDKHSDKDTLLKNIALEMTKGYEMVQDVINKLLKDERIDQLIDEEGNIIGQKTYMHPQLLKWITEMRHFLDDMWKMGGGEIQQEAEKEKLKLQAKLIVKVLGVDPDKREEMLNKWKSSKSYKE